MRVWVDAMVTVAMKSTLTAAGMPRLLSAHCHPLNRAAVWKATGLACVRRLVACLFYGPPSTRYDPILHVTRIDLPLAVAASALSVQELGGG